MKIPEKILGFASAVKVAGGRAVLVGGCVRDELMKKTPKDWDLEVFGIEPLRLRELVSEFGKVNAVGEAFTVYKVGRDLDVSLPRREKKIGRGHKGFEVTGDPEMTFEEAAKRRDFTINSIMKDPLTGDVFDPFDGRGDIDRRILRAVSLDTFAEDSLRVLRAAQFAARFQFELSPETAEICRSIDLSDLPPDRIWVEFEKLLLLSEMPSIGLAKLYDLGVADKLFPELKSLRGVRQEPEWHPEGDVDVHTLLVTDQARKLIDDLPAPKKVTVMLGALCHDFGKPATTEFIDGRWRSRGHEEAGVQPTESFLDRLNVHKLDGYDVRANVVELVRQHLKPGMFYNERDVIRDGAFRRLAQKIEPDLLYRVSKADSLGRNAPWVAEADYYGTEAQDWFIEKVRELDVLNKVPKPILMGRHLIALGLEPSSDFNKILNAVFEEQLDGKIVNLDQAIDAAKSIIDESESN